MNHGSTGIGPQNLVIIPEQPIFFNWEAGNGKKPLFFWETWSKRPISDIVILVLRVLLLYMQKGWLFIRSFFFRWVVFCLVREPETVISPSHITVSFTQNTLARNIRLSTPKEVLKAVTYWLIDEVQ